MNNKNIINCPECGAALDIDNVLFHQLDEKAKNSLQDEYNAVDWDLFKYAIPINKTLFNLKDVCKFL